MFIEKEFELEELKDELYAHVLENIERPERPEDQIVCDLYT